ncbi:NUDIX domain-containing protein [Candidatus Saccharibacteria bacterium]|nr:NUDIX domain-containing protein [Candidatus Saccharibacteria bacterium]
MTNIAVANANHRRLKKGVFIAVAHNSGNYECLNAHCWVVCSDVRKVLLQKRGSKELCFTNMYDISFAGHIDEGENSRQAIVREAWEEGGININPYLAPKPKKYIFTEKGVYNNELFVHNQQAYVYIVTMSESQIKKISADNIEVSGFRLIDFSRFKHMIKVRDKHLAPHPINYYLSVVKDMTATFEAIEATK